MAELTAHVALFDGQGVLQQFGPGDEVPEWAQRKITNPNVWEDGEAPFPADGDDDGGSDGPPPKSGKGSGIRAWRKYAEDNHVDVDGLDTPEEVWTKLEAESVATEAAPVE